MARPPQPPPDGGSDQFTDAIDAALKRERGASQPPSGQAFDAVLREGTGLPRDRIPAPPPPGRRFPWLWLALTLLAVAAGAAGFFYRPYTVEVSSTPEGAEVRIDGAAAGRTPATLTFRSRPAKLRLELAGYEPVDAVLDFSDGSRALVRLALPRLVRFESEPPGAAIVVDEIDTGLVTPAAVSIKEPYPGKVELRLDGFLVANVPVTVELVQAARSSTALQAAASEPSAQDTQTRVTISGSYAFAVNGCGTESAAAESHTFSVEAPCSLHLSAPDYLLDATRDVEETTERRVEISAPAIVNVQLRSRYEACALTVNGRQVGTPPVDVKVVEGRYSATLRCPDGRMLKTRPFEIAAGQTVRRLDDFLP